MNILVLNAGSSSQKNCLYQVGEAGEETPPTPLWEGKIEWSAPGGPAMTVKVREAKHQETLSADVSRREGVSQLLETLWKGEGAVLGGPDEIAVVGHRVVHGGSGFRESTRVTEDVKAAIDRLTPLAPEHNPAAREGIDIIEQVLGPKTPQIAVFDTAFHRTIPEAAVLYPGPYQWVEEGIRRYGFHGINHAWCAERAPRLLPRRDPATLRLILCHLGNGCSLCAVRGGQSVDTTMGFTPMEGLMMGSRSGSVDPGILLYLLRRPGGPTPDELTHLINEESGLKGLSGISEDMRAVATAAEKGDARAAMAIDVYVHRLRQHIGAMAASLGGLDALIFTAGVGENSATIRAATCEKLGFLGIELDEARNHAASSEERDIASDTASARVLVIPAQEDWAVARECRRLLEIKSAI